MIAELLTALKAVQSLPKILEAIERLGDIQTAQMANSRAEEKNQKVLSAIDAARERRLRNDREAERVSGDSGKTSDRDGADNREP